MGTPLSQYWPRILAAHRLDERHLDAARQIRSDTSVPAFTTAEQRVLLRYFSNVNRNTFFIRNLPDEVAATLLAMYSRLGNPRGIRGQFLDGLLPEMPILEELGYTPEQYLQAVSAERVRKFLTTWLDSFGHNSIARMGSVHLCCERISTLAAKAIEQARPGAGYIELSTRFVNMDRAELYPAWLLAAPYRQAAEDALRAAFTEYGYQWLGHREHWGDVFSGQLSEVPAERKAQLTGKLGDTIGNALPAAVLTSVGVTAMGEAYASVVKHLLLEGTPECLVLAEEIVAEADACGAEQFLRHFVPSDAELDWAAYGPAPVAMDGSDLLVGARVELLSAPSAAEAAEAVSRLAGVGWPQVLGQLAGSRSADAGSHDKLPRAFEAAVAVFGGTMSFRTWRDLHRQGMSTHTRSYLSPFSPLYVPPDVRESYVGSVMARLEQLRAVSLSCRHLGWSPAMQQYLALLGNAVSYRLAHNLRQAEFVGWQRSSWGAHHEVRWHALAMDSLLAGRYPWWTEVARADRTPDYVFARGAVKHPRQRPEPQQLEVA